MWTSSETYCKASSKPMEQSPSRETSSVSASQDSDYSFGTKFSVLFRQQAPHFLYSARLIQPNSLYCKIYFNIILHSTIRSSLCPLSFTSPDQNLVWISLLPHMTGPLYWFWFNHSKNIWSGSQIIKLLNGKFSPVSFYFLPKHPIFEHPWHPWSILFT